MALERTLSNDLSTHSRALPGVSQITLLEFVHVFVLGPVHTIGPYCPQAFHDSRCVRTRYDLRRPASR